MSQKHLNSIKSIFGGIKNWWNGDKDKEASASKTENPTSSLQATLDSNSASQPHPAMKYRSDDGRGFYDNDDDFSDDKFMRGSRNPQGKKQYFAPVTNSAREQRLNDNLGKYYLDHSKCFILITCFTKNFLISFIWPKLCILSLNSSYLAWLNISEYMYIEC